MDHVSASRRVFEIVELLEQVLQHLSSPELARMARVACLAHQPSIKRLWGKSSPRRFDHLVNLLPSPPGVAKVKELGCFPSRKFSLSVTESDWTRFKHYSVYVTEVRITGSHIRIMHLSIKHLNNGYFPRLRRIYLSLCLSECLIRRWFAIAGPTLQTLEIGAHYNAPVASLPETLLPFNSLLQQIPLQSPSLAKLTLPGFTSSNATLFSDERFVLAFRSALTSLKCLTHFTWLYDNIPLDLIQIIISLPRLSHIALGDVPLLSQGNLPSLISLDLRSCSEGAIGSWLGRMRSLDLLTRSRLLAVKEVDRTIARSGSPPSYVRSLGQALNLNDIQIEVRDPADVWWSTLRPLLECRSISKFNICVTGDLLSFDDDALKEIAMSWRELEVFCVTERSATEAMSQDADYQPLATLCGLGWLALFCPRLSTITIQLSLCIDAWELEEVIPQAQSKLSAPLSIDLDLGYSQFGTRDREDLVSDEFLSPRKIAQILRIFWPALQIDDLSSEWADADLDDEFQSLMWDRYQSFKDAMVDLVEKAALESRISTLEEKLVSEKAQLREERDRLAERCLQLEQEMLKARGGQAGS